MAEYFIFPLGLYRSLGHWPVVVGSLIKTGENFLYRSSPTDTRPNPSSCRLVLHDLQEGMGGFQATRMEGQSTDNKLT